MTSRDRRERHDSRKAKRTPTRQETSYDAQRAQHIAQDNTFCQLDRAERPLSATTQVATLAPAAHSDHVTTSGPDASGRGPNLSDLTPSSVGPDHASRI